MDPAQRSQVSANVRPAAPQSNSGPAPALAIMPTRPWDRRWTGCQSPRLRVQRVRKPNWNRRCRSRPARLQESVYDRFSSLCASPFFSYMAVRR